MKGSQEIKFFFLENSQIMHSQTFLQVHYYLDQGDNVLDHNDLRLILDASI